MPRRWPPMATSDVRGWPQATWRKPRRCSARSFGKTCNLEVASVYGDGGPEALKVALQLFVDQPELGFVWMARDGVEVVGCCVVCYAISTSRGSIVAKLDDV